MFYFLLYCNAYEENMEKNLRNLMKAFGIYVNGNDEWARI